jgi:photosystem II stability/assembly factor-like uncharacterized protein
MNTIFKIFFFFLLLPLAVDAQWNQQNSGTTINFQCVDVVNNNVIWAGGNDGLIVNTNDGGLTWNIKTSTQTGYYNFGIASFDINTAVVIGSTYPTGTWPYQSKIWKTIDGGNTWSEKYYASSNVCGSIYFFDSNNGIYLGDPNPLNSSEWNLLTTTDGGDTWVRVPSSNYPPADNACGEFGITRSFGVSGETIWFSTYYDNCPNKNNRIYRSTDKGYNWSAFDMPYQGYTAGWIAFSSPTYGVAVSDPYGLVSRTTDAGISWATIDTISLSPPTAVRNMPGYNDIFLAVGEDGSTNGKSYLSNNSGYFWRSLSAPSQSSLRDVSLTKDSAWAVGANGTILTLNLAFVVPVELVSFTAQAENQKVILRWTTATELNNNGFEIQRKVAESDFATVGFVRGEGTTTNQREYSYIDKDLADGKYFYRLKQVDYNGTYEYSNVIEVDVRSLNDYALEQNFPNPFNPTTTIGYVLREKSNAKLILLNAIGEEVAALVNEEQDKGYHKVDFNAANLPSGVYFYRLQAGDFVETLKMILLK